MDLYVVMHCALHEANYVIGIYTNRHLAEELIAEKRAEEKQKELNFKPSKFNKKYECRDDYYLEIVQADEQCNLG